MYSPMTWSITPVCSRWRWVLLRHAPLRFGDPGHASLGNRRARGVPLAGGQPLPRRVRQQRVEEVEDRLRVVSRDPAGEIRGDLEVVDRPPGPLGPPLLALDRPGHPPPRPVGGERRQCAAQVVGEQPVRAEDAQVVGECRDARADRRLWLVARRETAQARDRLDHLEPVRGRELREQRVRVVGLRRHQRRVRVPARQDRGDGPPRVVAHRRGVAEPDAVVGELRQVRVERPVDQSFSVEQ